MNIFDLFIAHIAWGSSGKLRPVLIIGQQEEIMSVFNITTQYEGKSEVVRSKYFLITDWKQAGLDKPSYVDTNTVRDLPKAAWDGKTAIGKLTESDTQGLIEFLAKF